MWGYNLTAASVLLVTWGINKPEVLYAQPEEKVIPFVKPTDVKEEGKDKTCILGLQILFQVGISRGTISGENRNYQEIMGFNMENFTVLL